LTPDPRPSIIWGQSTKHQMSTAQETVQGIVIDVCTRTFLLFSDQGSERRVECDTVEEFMNVLEVITAQLDPEQIEYADLAVYGQ